MSSLIFMGLNHHLEKSEHVKYVRLGDERYRGDQSLEMETPCKTFGKIWKTRMSSSIVIG
jgi:hypothetical protein